QVLKHWVATEPVQSLVLVGIGFGRELAAVSSVPMLVGLDLSAGMIALTRARIPGATLIQGDVTNLPLRDRSVDLVVTAACLVHVPPPLVDRALAETMRVGRKVGYVEPSLLGEPERYEGEWTWRWDYVSRIEALGGRVLRQDE